MYQIADGFHKDFGSPPYLQLLSVRLCDPIIWMHALSHWVYNDAMYIILKNTSRQYLVNEALIGIKDMQT